MKRQTGEFRYAVKTGVYGELGVRKCGADVCFTAAAPEGTPCSLLLYQKGAKEPEAQLPMEEGDACYGDLRTLWIEGLPTEAYEYNYEIGGRLVTDPYAARLSGRETWGKAPEEPGDLRGQMDFTDYDWEGDQPLCQPWKEIVAYAAHVRAFTKHPSSGVRAKGTFAGIQEKIPELTALGVNLLELMPVYEFAEAEDFDGKSSPFRCPVGEEPLLNCWGYTDAYYFAPKASYSYTGDPVRELKDLVKALHKNGIELVLEFYFPKGTRVGLVLDCIRYWVLHYHIDGVHVNRDGAPVEALAQEPLLSHTKILSEGFALEEIYREREVPAFRNLAEYNDAFLVDARRFLKGDEGMLAAFAWRARRNPGTAAVINYLANHNGFTLWDAVSYEEKHNEANGEKNRDGTDFNYSWNCGEEGPSRKRKVNALRARQLRNAFVLLLLSQGTPLIYSGDERGNSQSGNNNAYCQDNALSWVNWKPGRTYAFLPDYVRELIAFRRRHPVFHQAQELTMTDSLSCGCPDISYHGEQAWIGGFENYGRHLGIMLAGEYIAARSGGARTDDTFYLACNMHWIPHEFALPVLPGGESWYLAIDTNEEGLAGLYPEGAEALLPEQRTVTVPARTIFVLRGRKPVESKPGRGKGRTR